MFCLISSNNINSNHFIYIIPFIQALIIIRIQWDIITSVTLQSHLNQESWTEKINRSIVTANVSFLYNMVIKGVRIKNIKLLHDKSLSK